MLNNFIEHNVNGQDIQIVCSVSDPIHPNWKKLDDHFKNVEFFFYPDTRVNKTYPSSIRPNTLKKHFKRFPELVEYAIFYHDCDILLTKELDLDPFLQDSSWYLSNVDSYIASHYIKSKEFNVFEEMCQIIDIAPEYVEYKELQSGAAGGAQYLMKGVSHLFWHKVEIDCTNLYLYFIKKHEQYPESDYHPVQEWTADMWAVLWNAWLFGNRTNVPDELTFLWPMDGYGMIKHRTIYHNAGVTEDPGFSNFFRKSDYINKLPYDEDLDIDNLKATNYYWEWVKKTKDISCLR